MFNNIGSKIKTLAIVLCLFKIVGCIITGFVVMYTINFMIGLLISVVGSLISWISLFFIYGFGQLIENSDIIVSQNKKILESNSVVYQNNNVFANSTLKGNSPIPNSNNITLNEQKWICLSCGKIISSNPCPHCYYYL